MEDLPEHRQKKFCEWLESRTEDPVASRKQLVKWVKLSEKMVREIPSTANNLQVMKWRLEALDRLFPPTRTAK
jgi:hypothetical protein